VRLFARCKWCTPPNQHGSNMGNTRSTFTMMLHNKRPLSHVKPKKHSCLDPFHSNSWLSITPKIYMFAKIWLDPPLHHMTLRCQLLNTSNKYCNALDGQSTQIYIVYGIESHARYLWTKTLNYIHTWKCHTH
jgi:hypothetical protein